MKKQAILLILICMVLWSFAQNSGFSYQAVIRNAAGELVKNKTIGMRVTILKGSASGTQVYTEMQTPSTNTNGLATLEIGKGTPSAFAAINWADGPYFMKTETDPNGGTSYSITGTSQLLNVPFANWAVKAGNGINLLTTPKSGDILFNNGVNWELLSKGSNGQTLRLDNGLPRWAEPGYALPLLTTLPVTDVMQTAATCGGNIVNTGFTEISARGVCWSVSQNPTVADSKTNEGSGTGGSFTSAITSLLPNTTYYVRAYATNAAGTAYGNQLTFKTYQNVVFPTITTVAATNVLSSTATSGGNITETGGAPVTGRGVCWSTNQNPTVADNKTSDGSGTGNYSSAIAGLDPGTQYYVRAYATNSAGTGYGAQVTLTTQKTVPIVVTKNITDISAMGAVSGGTIAATGGSAITEKGIVWGENPNPTLGDNVITAGTGQAGFSSAVIKAIPNTTYYVRAYAKSDQGVGYGDQKNFKTSEAQYFQSFETGILPVEWSGLWSVTNKRFFHETNCLLSHASASTSSTQITVNLTNNGKLSFFYNVGNSSNWSQALLDITSGIHTIKWQISANTGVIDVYLDNIKVDSFPTSYALGYIDYIVITK